MSKSSERVKKWRKVTKERIVNAMGGECVICGYSKLNDALDLHHLDPAEKDFSFGRMRANPKSWATIVSEVKKCVLLCCRCHREVHASLVDIPDELPEINTDIEDFDTVLREIPTHPCKLCGKETILLNKFCSLSCSSKSRYKVDWDNIDLENMYKTLTVVEIADRLSISDAAVHKRLKKLGLK